MRGYFAIAIGRRYKTQASDMMKSARRVPRLFIHPDSASLRSRHAPLVRSRREHSRLYRARLPPRLAPGLRGLSTRVPQNDAR